MLFHGIPRDIFQLFFESLVALAMQCQLRLLKIWFQGNLPTCQTFLDRNVKFSRCFATLCGNFVAVGYSSGHVDLFNVQSGLFRGSFIDQEVPEWQYCRDRGHDGSITSVSVDQLSIQLVSTCDQGWLKIWNFKVTDYRNGTWCGFETFLGFLRIRSCCSNNWCRLA